MGIGMHNASNADLYTMSRMLLGSIFNTLLIFTYWWEIQIYMKFIFNYTAYTRYDVLWFTEKMDLNSVKRK
jgi:hypothetical protein